MRFFSKRVANVLLVSLSLQVCGTSPWRTMYDSLLPWIIRGRHSFLRLTAASPIFPFQEAGTAAGRDVSIGRYRDRRVEEWTAETGRR